MLYEVIPLDVLRYAGAVCFLDLFRFRQGGTKPYGNIIGQVMPAHAKFVNEFQMVVFEQGQVCGAAAHIGQDAAKFLFFIGENCIARGQGLKRSYNFV